MKEKDPITSAKGKCLGAPFDQHSVSVRASAGHTQAEVTPDFPFTSMKTVA